MLPDDWDMVTLADVADYRAGRTPSRANAAYWEGPEATLPWVSIADMSDHQLVLNTKEKITPFAAEAAFRGRFSPAGTLLMSFKLTIGRIATLGVDAFHNEAIISIFPREGIDQRYLGYWLSQVDYDRLHDRQIKGNTLNQEKIDRIPVARPPIREQSDIADVLDAVRTGISIQTDAIEAAFALKRAAMRELFARGLRGGEQADSEIGPLPVSWSLERLGSLGKIGGGTTPNRTKSEFWDGGTIPWITSGKMYEREIWNSDTHLTPHGMKANSLPLLQPGALLIAIVGQGKTLGHCAILRVEATISRHVGYFQPDETVTTSGYIRAYLESIYDYLRQLASGNGSTRGALTAAILKDISVPVPPTLEEQAEITKISEAIDAKIGLHTRKKAVLEELFRALLYNLMTGEIRVADLNLSVMQSNQETAA